jgi:hypothetical protein
LVGARVRVRAREARIVWMSRDGLQQG